MEMGRYYVAVEGFRIACCYSEDCLCLRCVRSGSMYGGLVGCGGISWGRRK